MVTMTSISFASHAALEGIQVSAWCGRACAYTIDAMLQSGIVGTNVAAANEIHHDIIVRPGDGD
ncbi:hypothetical protein ABIA30_001286 [Mycobacterium sp. MAA66]|uniref:hypothetical protein n=1 Tax=Mycobacterium sp. MAA66 TaxID=3156297 RepID=UPI0035172F7B